MTGGTDRPRPLDAGHAAFIQGPMSVIVASRNAELVADVVRGCGCRVSRDRRQVTVLIEPGRANSLLEDVAANGMIAVVFSQPSTHQTIQLKGTDARVVRVTAADRAVCRRLTRRRRRTRGDPLHPDRRLPADARSRRRPADQYLSMPLSLPTLRRCFEGAIPATIATCSPDGTPNVSYISEVHYVDRQHVALSFQFFSKTRQNVLENPQATVVVIHPDTGAQYKLAVRYLRTEESGPLFECMKAKLAGLASHAGMTGVFKLRGSDVYRVESVIEVHGTPLAAPPPPEVDVTTLRACMARLSAAGDLAALLDTLLEVLADPIGIEHAMVLMHDPVADRLYTVASLGYAQSGVGAEVRPGDGIIGAAAQARIPIRISHATSEFGYGRAMREDAERRGVAGLEHEIPFPGLPESQSQIAVPILAGDRLLGVLFAESAATGRFGYDEEDGFMVLASHVGAVAALLEEEPHPPSRDERHPARTAATPRGAPLRVRRYLENDSIFVDEDYLIKGVAGAILWRLLLAHADDGRADHTNRELRLDPAIRLPDLSENLEARLILLARRLEERCTSLRIEKTGRGRFRFHVLRPVTLVEVPR